MTRFSGMASGRTRAWTGNPMRNPGKVAPAPPIQMFSNHPGKYPTDIPITAPTTWAAMTVMNNGCTGRRSSQEYSNPNGDSFICRLTFALCRAVEGAGAPPASVDHQRAVRWQPRHRSSLFQRRSQASDGGQGHHGREGWRSGRHRDSAPHHRQATC